MAPSPASSRSSTWTVSPSSSAFSCSGEPVATTLPRSRIASSARELVGLLQVVRGEQDGQALLVGQALDLLPHLGADLGVEAGRGLVQEENLRPVHERRGDVEPALHSARVVTGDAFRRILQPELIEQLLDAVFQLTAVDRADESLQAQVLAPAQIDVDARGLPDDADRRAHLLGLRDGIETYHAHAARGGEGEGGRDLDGGRLARAVRPSNPKTEPAGTTRSMPSRARIRALIDLDQALDLDRVAVLSLFVHGVPGNLAARPLSRRVAGRHASELR